MRSDKKIAYLMQRIAELEKDNVSLQKENAAISHRLEVNETAILSQKKLLEEKERQVDDTLNVYERAIAELRKVKKDYETAIILANKSKNKMEADFKKLLNRLKKQ